MKKPENIDELSWPEGGLFGNKKKPNDSSGQGKVKAKKQTQDKLGQILDLISQIAQQEPSVLDKLTPVAQTVKSIKKMFESKKRVRTLSLNELRSIIGDTVKERKESDGRKNDPASFVSKYIVTHVLDNFARNIDEDAKELVEKMYDDRSDPPVPTVVSDVDTQAEKCTRYVLSDDELIEAIKALSAAVLRGSM